MSGRLSRPGSQRRTFVAETFLGAAALAWPRLVQAGAQVEEPLADAVRSALSAAIAERAPPKPTFGSANCSMPSANQR